MLPLYSFISFLSVKYIVAFGFVAVIFVLIRKALASGGSTYTIGVVANIVTFGAILLSLAFIIFVIIKMLNGANFGFLPMAISASVVFFLAALTLSFRDVLADSSNFHVLQVLLPIIASLVVGVVFSGFVKIAQKLISG